MNKTIIDIELGEIPLILNTDSKTEAKHKEDIVKKKIKEYEKIINNTSEKTNV